MRLRIIPGPGGLRGVRVILGGDRIAAGQIAMDKPSKADIEAAPDGSRLWQQLLPWLLLAASVALLVWSLVRVWPLVGGALANRGSASTGPRADYVELGTSTHFRIVGPGGYMGQRQVEGYLAEAEVRRAQLVEFLGVPGDARQVRIVVHPQWGLPNFDPPASVTLYGLKTGRNALIHELTHLIMECGSNFLSEGLAVMTEERFGWGLAFPNWLRPVDSYLYAWMRGGHELLSLEDLSTMGSLWDSRDPESSRLRYLHAGSFTKYLVGAYGLDAFVEVCGHSDFQRAYGRSLRELEAEWLATVNVGHMLQGLGVTVGGLVTLALLHVAMTRGWPWIVVAIAGLLAFAVWNFYLVYTPVLHAGLLAAVMIGVSLGLWRRTWGLALLWGIGAASLLLLVLAPPTLALLGN